MTGSGLIIRRAPGTWVARTHDTIIAETRDASELFEGELPPAVCFPPGDVGAFLEPSATVTDCPRKGRIRHYHVVVKGARLADAAWSLAAPPPGARAIARHVFFDTRRITVEEI